MVVDDSYEKIQEISDKVSYAMKADVTDKDALQALGARNLDGAVVAVSEHPEANIMATLLCKEMGIPLVVAKAKDKLQGTILEKVGADSVVYPEIEMGSRIAKSMVANEFVDWIELSNDYSIVEIAVPRRWEGKSLAELDVRKKYGITVVGVMQGEKMDLSFDPQTPLPGNVILVLIGANKILEIPRIKQELSFAQIKELAKLQKKSRLRDERRIFLVEGPRMVEEIPKERIERLYISESFERKNPAYIRELGMPAEVLSDPVFSYVSDTKNPQGILAVVKRLEYTMEDVLGKSALKCEEKSGEKEKNPENHQIRVPHVIVLDNLQDPGNLGTIFRTAEAAGATGILLSSDSVDVYNPKVIRSTMGAVFRMPFFYVKDLPAAVKSLSSQGIRTYAAHLNGKNVYDEEDYTEGCAFLIGNEGNGLRDEVSECADCLIRIPMCGKAESLNAAVAAAVLMFEAGRQRRK